MGAQPAERYLFQHHERLLGAYGDTVVPTLSVLWTMIGHDPSHSLLAQADSSVAASLRRIMTSRAGRRSVHILGEYCLPFLCLPSLWLPSLWLPSLSLSHCAPRRSVHILAVALSHSLFALSLSLSALSLCPLLTS